MKITNPHSVIAALLKRPKDVTHLVIQGEKPSDDWVKVIRLAERSNVKILNGEPHRGQKSVAGGGRSLNFYAEIQPRSEATLEDAFPRKAPEMGLWLALDCIQDPQNLGSIFRIAAFFGVRGILTTTDRSAELTEAVYNIASGGVEYVPFTREVNLARSLTELKERGYWILGSSEHVKESFKDLKMDRAWILVVGNEEEGIRRLVLETCDQVVSIPSPVSSEVGSLNVAMATSILVSGLLTSKGK